MNSYFIKNGKYQKAYVELLSIINNPNMEAFKIAVELYNEFYNNRNENITTIENNEVRIKSEWLDKFEFIRNHIPDTYYTRVIIDKIIGGDISIDMDILYEKLMDSIIEYKMLELYNKYPEIDILRYYKNIEEYDESNT